MKQKKISITLSLLSALIFPSLVFADFESAMQDQRDGKYESAFAQFVEASEAGDTRAHGKLASMYLYGLGTEKDYAKAYVWFGIARHTGDKYAGKFQKAASSGLSAKQVEEAEAELARAKEEIPCSQKIKKPWDLRDHQGFICLNTSSSLMLKIRLYFAAANA